MKALHPDRADAIEVKKREALRIWEDLRRRAADRKAGLDRSYMLHRFFADYRDLMSWISDMKAIISADELARDVAGAEALLERHHEHKVRNFDQYVALLTHYKFFQGEIDAREDSFRSTADAGQRLLDEGIPQSDEVKEKVRSKFHCSSIPGGK